MDLPRKLDTIYRWYRQNQKKCMNGQPSPRLAILQCKDPVDIIIPVNKSEMETILGTYAAHGILQASGPSCWLYYECDALRSICIPGLYELYKLGSRPLFPPYLITASAPFYCLLYYCDRGRDRWSFFRAFFSI